LSQPNIRFLLFMHALNQAHGTVSMRARHNCEDTVAEIVMPRIGRKKKKHIDMIIMIKCN
jgi:hypothetical protein